MEEFKCGDLKISKKNEVITIPEGQTASKETASGKAEVFKVTGPRGTAVKIAVTSWKNGEADVKAFKVEGPIEISSLCRQSHIHGGRLRIGIYPHDSRHFFMDLRQARIQENSPNYWATACNATKGDLDKGSGLDSFAILRQAGGVEVGTREKVLMNKDRNRNRLCAVFEKKNVMFPAVAFTLTRVMPLLRKMKAG